MNEQEIQKLIDNTLAKAQYSVAKVPAHHHDGTDSLRVPYLNLEEKFFLVPHTLFGATPATAANYGVFFIAPFDCYVSAFSEVHSTAGTVDATLQLEKLTGTQALDSGTALLLTAISLTATADTVQYGTLVGTTSASGVKHVTLNKGDRLALKDINTLTTLANLTTVTMVNF